MTHLPDAPDTAILTLWRAGGVNRWHTSDSHALRNSQDTNWAHSARVATLAMTLFPGRDDVIRDALTHDMPEKLTGDVSGEVKRNNPALREAHDDAEAAWYRDNGIPRPVGSPELHLCDQLDAILWASQVDPAVLRRDDWQRQIERVRAQVDILKVGGAVRKALATALGED